MNYEGLTFDFIYPNLSFNAAFTRLSAPVDNSSRQQESIDYVHGDYLIAVKGVLDKGTFGEYVDSFKENRYFSEYILFDIPYLELSYVNAHRQGETASHAFIGTSLQTNAYEFYIRISAREIDASSKASVYYVQALADDTPVTVEFIPQAGATENNGTDPNGRYVTEVSNGNSLVYKVSFDLSSTSNVITNCVVNMLVANDYIIQYSENESFNDIYGQTKLPSDVIYVRETKTSNYANAELLKYRVGRYTSYHNVGLKVMYNVLGWNFLYAVNMEFDYKRFPSHAVNNVVPDVREPGLSHYLIMNRHFGDVSLYADIYHVSFTYDTLFKPDPSSFYAFVDDDDNDDGAQGLSSSGSVSGPEYPVYADADGDNVYDFQQAFMGLTSLPFFFISGQQDRNNNDIPDNREDDLYPDTLFHSDMKGHTLEGVYNKNGLRLTLGYYNDTLISKGITSWKVEGTAFYETRISKNARFSVETGIAKVNDNIPSYALNVEDFQYLVNNPNIAKNDPITENGVYENSIKMFIATAFSIDVGERFSFAVRTKLQDNMQLTEGNHITKSGIVFDAGFTQPLTKDLSFLIQSRTIMVNRNDVSDTYMYIDAQSALENFAVMLEANLGRLITAKAGYNVRAFYDMMNTDNNMIIHSAAMNYILKDEQNGTEPFAYLIIAYNYYDSINDSFVDYDDFTLKTGIGARY